MAKDNRVLITFDANHDGSIREFSRKGIKFCNEFINNKIMFLGFKISANDCFPFDNYKTSINVGIIKLLIRKDEDKEKIDKILENIKVLDKKEIDSYLYIAIDCSSIKE